MVKNGLQKGDFSTTFGHVMIATFDPLNKKPYPFIFVSESIKVVNLVKFSQLVFKILCSQTFSTQAHISQQHSGFNTVVTVLEAQKQR